MKKITFKKIIYVFFISATLFTLGACEKSIDQKIVLEDNEDETAENYNYTSDYKYNLNVVYFVAKDRVINPGYEQRISKIMIEGQKFFNKWMKHWGYGDITYGLLKDAEKKRIKIHTIYGTQNSSSYQSGMDGAVRTEIEQYFAQNAGSKTSDHVLVLMAVNEKLDNGEELANSVPFYASNKYGYALEYPGMSQDNLGIGGEVGDKATVYIGGLLHEMGHAINLPHNGPSESKFNSSEFGMTLMGGGNYTYGKSPTYLSKFDAATLVNCQIFSKTINTFYGAASSEITELEATYENGEIVISGKYNVSVPISSLSFYYTPETSPEGYTAVTWTVDQGTGNSFNIRMPISEFREKANLNYSLHIFFHHQNGVLSSKPYAFKFINDVPEISFGDKHYLDRAVWTIIESSLSQNGYPAVNILDGNPNSYWHSSWTNTNIGHPHHVTIKTSESSVTASGISILPRPESGSAGKIKAFTIETSIDGIVWTQVYSGNMVALNGYQNFNFDSVKTFKYLKVNSLSDHNQERYASIAEINLF